LKNFEFENWDNGHLIVNAKFASVLKVNGFTTFDALMNDSGGDVAKNLLRERITSRFSLRDSSGNELTFYIKKHQPPPFREYVKPFFRLTWPILGAKNEWNAILRFHESGIATMVPAAFGEKKGQSFVITQAVEGCEKLSEWMETRLANGSRDEEQTADIVNAVARIARQMHGAGLHHQDFYLTHLLCPLNDENSEIHVIDLGRARRLNGLSRRWIVKDLAQLNYSAHLFSEEDRQRFLETYFGRPINASDKPLLRSIRHKTERIASHSRKNRL
jgi:tRNA A-37 threonylcarbamoyl transferase component Bud32